MYTGHAVEKRSEDSENQLVELITALLHAKDNTLVEARKKQDNLDPADSDR